MDTAGSRPSVRAILDASSVREELARSLLTLRNGDGGWPYGPRKRSRLEPTCWALLALGQHASRPPDADVLRRWPRREDWLVDVSGAPVNYAFNALAALTLLETSVSPAEPIVRRLLGAAGLRAAPMKELRQDNSLRAWGWVEDTFSWVEPTAWCTLLLKKVGPQRAMPRLGERVREAERMLVDRACQTGGWNYGNSNAYGKELPAYVPTTALALLAMQDRRDHPVVQKGLDQLTRDVRAERSRVALALTVICLRAYGLPVAELALELAELAVPRPSEVDAPDVLRQAVALYALASLDSDPAALMLSRAS